MPTESFFSHILGVEKPYTYLLPAEYEAQPERRFPVVYLLHGLGGKHTDWLQHTRLARYAATRPFIFVLPDAERSWYSDAYDGRSDYESHFIEELLPTIERTYRTVEERNGRALIGLSMGGFGAIKLALQYPDRFCAAASHSGALRPTHARNVPESPHPVFGDHTADAALRRKNDPLSLAEERAADPLRPAIYLDCGTSDPLLEISRRFHKRLLQLGIRHQYHEYAGYHTWPYWNRVLRHSLDFAAGHLHTDPPEG